MEAKNRAIKYRVEKKISVYIATKLLKQTSKFQAGTLQRLPHRKLIVKNKESKLANNKVKNKEVEGIG